MNASRIHTIDFWRGIALISIFIDHIPGNMLEGFTHRNAGFSDPAEAFVFLSGISVALAWGMRFLRGEKMRSLRALGFRTLTLYGVQVWLSFIAIALFTATAVIFDDDDLLGIGGRDILRIEPLQGLVAVAGLTHQIAYFNILPMYIVFLLFTPALLYLARISPNLMLLASATLYLIARLLTLNLPTWPTPGVWVFNPLTWQFLFTLGLYIGLALQNPRNPRPRRHTATFLLCLVVVALSAFLITDGFHTLPGLMEELWPVLDADKTDLGTVRLVHFLALAYVIYTLRPTRLLQHTRVFRACCLLGRNSLPVFAVGSLLDTVGQIAFARGLHSPSIDLLMIGSGILIQCAVAWLFQQRRLVQRQATV